MKSLPIDAVLPQLTDALRTHANAVLVAQPGAGKTTRVPLALLQESWLGNQRIIMLEPRRLAARSAARYMAQELGEMPGETVGYRVRLDTKVGPATRIEVVTEGVLTRMLQEDPALEGIGAVLFDEFHERHLHSDLGLALCLQTQSLLRDDLRLLIMSATLDAEPVSELLGGAPVISSEGRQYPVNTLYANRGSSGQKLEEVAASTALTAVQEGDVLVFLPGMAEIRRTDVHLRRMGLPSGVSVKTLHGSMPLQEQDEAIAPCAPGERKIVLATSIAESSLTVQGIKAVVDSGRMRVPRFSPRTGMTRLETVSVSKASADQRRGRAGRLGPGSCYRLWTEQEHGQLPASSTPELMEADLAPLVLELAVWGVSDPAELAWLDVPPQGSFTQAAHLLRSLGALDEAGRITPRGKAMAELGGHPRLAHMAIEAQRLGSGEAACQLAAVLSERDLLRNERSADVRLRVEALREWQRGRNVRSSAAAEDNRFAAAAMAKADAEARQWSRALKQLSKDADINAGAASDGEPPWGLLIALAYPDRIAQRRADGRYLLANGRGAALTHIQPISQAAYLAAAELEDSGLESRIDLAAPLSLDEIELALLHMLETEQEVSWNKEAGAVRARKRLRLGALILQESPLGKVEPELLEQALLDGIRAEGISILPWSRQAQQLKDRMTAMHAVNKSYPDVSDEALAESMEEWLQPYIHGMKSKDDLRKVQLTDALESMLSWAERKELDAQMPTHITLPSSSRVPIDYSDPAAPMLAARLQELFGMKQTPRIGGGKVPLTLHLLSPARRPVQVTRDLESFWSGTYFEVKKDLKGRYPKHYWPDNPLEAEATSRTKPRSQ